MSLPTYGPLDANGPAMRSTPITLSDTAPIASYNTVCLFGIRVGGVAGTAYVIRGLLANDTAPQDFACVGGEHVQYRFKQIHATGTTAPSVLGIGI